MTTEPNNHENDSIDELTGKWFDSEVYEVRGDIPSPCNPKQIRRAAELQLVHSMLMQLADRDELGKERRIQNLMVKISDGNNLYVRLYHFTKPLLRYGIAAVLIISIVLLFTQLPTNSAMASIDKMIAAIDSAGDRTYSIKVEHGGQDFRPPRPGQYQQRGRELGERAGLDGATLYLRGSKKFVLYWKTPSGKTVMNGSDGQTNWHIRPDKPVLVSNNPEAFRIPMPPELAAILSLDLKATLVHIRDNYKVKYLKDVADDQKQNISWTYLDASKLSKDFPGPKNIEIWADSQTGLLQRIEFADIHLEDDPSPQRLIIELVNQTQLSDDWFTHQAHHSQDTEVDFISE
jgi:hypothetical protein